MRRLGDLEPGGDGGFQARAAVAPGKRTRTEAIQRRAASPGSEPTTAAPEISGGGAPLAEPARSRMEAGFGTDLSAVRVHEGSHVDALGAVAYAQGTDLHFAPGHYDPSSQRGQELIGHEVAHVMQQAEGRVAATTQYKGVAVNDDAGLEREADELGVRVARGEQVAQGWRLGGERAVAAQRARGAIQRVAPGRVEHVNNSCYAASVITLLSRVGAYRTAFDPAQNVLPPAPPHDAPAAQRRAHAVAIQQAVTPLLALVHAGNQVSGAQIDNLVGVLHAAGITIGERDDQQDAGLVMMSMLEMVQTAANQAQFATRSQETRDYDNGAPQRNDTAWRPIIQLYADGNATLEQALLAEFPTNRHVVAGDDGVALADPHTLNRHALQLPNVLTVSVTHRNDREAVDMPAIFTMPAGILQPDVNPRPRYRMAGFIMRSHYGGGGGHYVSYVRDNAQWYHSNDLGGGYLPPDKMEKNLEASAKTKSPAVLTEPEVSAVPNMGTARYGGLPTQSFALGHVYTYELIGDDVAPGQARVPIGQVQVDPLPQPRIRKVTGGTGRTAPSSGVVEAQASPWTRAIDGKPIDLETLSVTQLLALLDAGKLAPQKAAAKTPTVEPSPVDDASKPSGKPTAESTSGPPVVLDKTVTAETTILVVGSPPSDRATQEPKPSSETATVTATGKDAPSEPPRADAPKPDGKPADDLLAYLAARARHELFESMNYVPGFDEAPRPRSSGKTAPATSELGIYQRAKELAGVGSLPALRYLRVMDYYLTSSASAEQLTSRSNEQVREKYCEQQLALPDVDAALTAEFIGWQRTRGEHLDAGTLRQSGNVLTRLIQGEGTPRQIVDQIMIECPELVEKYRVECASRDMKFYEHAQKVIGQYLKYFRHSEHPLVGVDAMVKMILFHDMDKKLAAEISRGLKGGGAKPPAKGTTTEPATSPSELATSPTEPATSPSESATAPSDTNPGRALIEHEVRGKGFSGLPVGTLEQRLNARKGKDAEHALTRIMMQKYGALWNTVEEAMLVTEMVDGDPIGEMMKTLGDKKRKSDPVALARAAAHEIEEMAQRAGIPRKDGQGLADFYHHVKMFYQADSSSYSADSSAVAWEDRTNPKAAPTVSSDKSALRGLYQRAEDFGKDGYTQDDEGFLQFNDEAQRRGIAALDAHFEKRAAESEGSDTARDTVDDRQGWGDVPQYTWGDFQIIAEIGKGSTKPMHVIDQRDHQHKFLKLGMSRDPIHVMTELLTNQLYDTVGAPVPDNHLILIEGQPAMIAPWNEKFESPGKAHEVQGSDDFLAWVGADFIFGNWDLFKVDNWQLSGGRMVRADNGGALDYRAQGDRKPEDQWEGGGIDGQMSMRTFGKTRDNDPYKDLTDRRVAYSVIRVADFLTARTIDQALEAAHCPVHRRAYLRTTLLNRLGQMLEWARARIKYREVPISHAPPGCFDLFKSGVASMIQALNCCSAPPPSTGTSDRATPIDHQGSKFAEWAKSKKVDHRFLADLERMRHGVLIRKCAPQEADSFAGAAALDAGHADDRHAQVFGRRGDPWRRGEAVFSVNRLYEFKREAANDNKAPDTDGAKDDATKGGTITEPPKDDATKSGTIAEPPRDDATAPTDTAATETTPLVPKPKPPSMGADSVMSWLSAIATWPTAPTVDKSKAPSLKNPVYTWVIEIPISDAALDYLRETALIQGIAYPDAYDANPNLKYENVKPGELPNLVMRSSGFEHLWQCLDKVRIFEPDEHVSVEPIPGTDEAEKAKETLRLLKIQQAIAAAKQKKEEEAAAANDNAASDDDDGGGMDWLFGSGKPPGAKDGSDDDSQSFL